MTCTIDTQSIIPVNLTLPEMEVLFFAEEKRKTNQNEKEKKDAENEHEPEQWD